MKKEQVSITTEDFSLAFEFEVYETDALIKTDVKSSIFSGCGTLDVSKKIIEDFSKDLQTLYDSLRGTVRIFETFGEQYVEFDGDGRGKISVRGLVIGHSMNGHMSEQRLAFENVIDQTFLADLCEAISAVL